MASIGPGPMRKKNLIALSLVVLLAAAGGTAWKLGSAEEPQAPSTATVTRADLSKTVLASGTIEAAQLVSVGAQVSGQLRTLAVALGDRVQKGDLIAEIDSSDQRADVARAEAALKQLQAQIKAKEASIRVAELSLTRQKTLNSKALSSDETRETAEATLDVAKAELEGLRAQLDEAQVTLSSAETELERTRIAAPISGTVVAIVSEEGTTLNANTSSPTIVKLAQLDRMVVKAEISEADVVAVKPGQAAAFTLNSSLTQPFEARLRALEPAPASIETSDTIDTDEAIYYNALLDVDNPEGILRIGMSAEVTITLDARKNVLTVPVTTIPRVAGGKAEVEVYDPATGRSETRKIGVGMMTDTLAEVTGLNEGDEVVLPSISAANSDTGRRNRPPMMGF
ncbi:macrolide-specific efflux system membrane fusion protein [Rhodobacter viridis]|uniref:Macrolide-specific efflux system membrane fusion protein n=2 Tax=Rhodobacter viridis TaxID=1054202 RepID=A0A318U1L8_9RHOB|nr:macrolide-specific efflux system membrane fusion protein [Rhodobacter viridis]